LKKENQLKQTTSADYKRAMREEEVYLHAFMT
jgi:hypothetical protein